MVQRGHPKLLRVKSVLLFSSTKIYCRNCWPWEYVVRIFGHEKFWLSRECSPETPERFGRKCSRRSCPWAVSRVWSRAHYCGPRLRLTNAFDHHHKLFRADRVAILVHFKHRNWKYCSRKSQFNEDWVMVAIVWSYRQWVSRSMSSHASAFHCEEA